LNQVEDFAVLIFWVKSDGKLVEIARIDNTEHPDDEEDGAHIHRWYREQNMHCYVSQRSSGCVSVPIERVEANSTFRETPPPNADMVVC